MKKILLPILIILTLTISMTSIARPASYLDSTLRTDARRALQHGQLVADNSINTMKTPCRQSVFCDTGQFGVDDIKPAHTTKHASPDSHRRGNSATTIYGAGDFLDEKTPLGFSHELDAVIAAMNHYNPLSIAEDREYIGVILEQDNYFFYTVEAGHRGSDKITFRLRMPRGFHIAAIWHTHGSPASERKYFSDVDTQLVKSLNKRFYLGDHTGNLKVFTPGDEVLSAYRAKRMGLPNKRGVGKGKPVFDDNGNVIQVATRS